MNDVEQQQSLFNLEDIFIPSRSASSGLSHFVGVVANKHFLFRFAEIVVFSHLVIANGRDGRDWRVVRGEKVFLMLDYMVCVTLSIYTHTCYNINEVMDRCTRILHLCVLTSTSRRRTKPRFVRIETPRRAISHFIIMLQKMYMPMKRATPI